MSEICTPTVVLCPTQENRLKVSQTLTSAPLCCADPPSTQAAGPSAAPSGFIRVQGGTFVDDNCDEFLLFGWNRSEQLLFPLCFASLSMQLTSMNTLF